MRISKILLKAIIKKVLFKCDNIEITAFPKVIKIYVDISLKNKSIFTRYSFQKENYIYK